MMTDLSKNVMNGPLGAMPVQVIEMAPERGVVYRCWTDGDGPQRVAALAMLRMGVRPDVLLHYDGLYWVEAAR
jgi:hypothetical protein